MPAEFESCAHAGGRVRRKSTSQGYINLCFDKQGKSHAGEYHKSSSSTSSTSKGSSSRKRPRYYKT